MTVTWKAACRVISNASIIHAFAVGPGPMSEKAVRREKKVLTSFAVVETDSKLKVGLERREEMIAPEEDGWSKSTCTCARSMDSMKDGSERGNSMLRTFATALSVRRVLRRDVPRRRWGTCQTVHAQD